MSLIIPANSAAAAGGYQVDNSLRFNSASDDYLKRTPSSSGNRKTWTWSSWVKKAARGSDNYEYIFNCTDASTTTGRITSVENAVDVFDFTDDLISLQLRPNALNRDFSAWYNLVVALDTTQGTAANRVKMYVNGEQITSFATANYPNQNVDGTINLVSGSYAHHIGSYVGTSNFFNGYMAEVCFIDGTALGADSFGEFDEDSGIWKPIDVSGLTFGTNGFYLDFEDSAALGDDVSGNGNDFTVNNLTAIDQSTDTCTNNGATLNPLNQNPSNQFVLENGNLSVASSTAVGTKNHGSSTLGVSSGKWYCEFKVDSGSYFVTGVSYDPSELARNNQDCGYYSSGWGYYQALGTVRNNDSGSSYGNSLSAGDILGIALDMDNNKLYFSKNGTFQNSGDPTSGSTGTGAVSITSGQTYFFVTGDADGSSVTTTSANFGAPPYAISSGNQDADGFGNFEFAVPSGYFALCTKNLAEYG